MLLLRISKPTSPRSTTLSPGITWLLPFFVCVLVRPSSGDEGADHERRDGDARGLVPGRLGGPLRRGGPRRRGANPRAGDRRCRGRGADLLPAAQLGRGREQTLLFASVPRPPRPREGGAAGGPLGRCGRHPARRQRSCVGGRHGRRQPARLLPTALQAQVPRAGDLGAPPRGLRQGGANDRQRDRLDGAGPWVGPPLRHGHGRLRHRLHDDRPAATGAGPRRVPEMLRARPQARRGQELAPQVRRGEDGSDGAQPERRPRLGVRVQAPGRGGWPDKPLEGTPRATSRFWGRRSPTSRACPRPPTTSTAA